MNEQKHIPDLLRKLHISTDNEQLYITAFTHPSYCNENPEVTQSYQRLEFLGDAVLSLLASTYLFNQFSDAPEGYLTDIRAALVRTEMLASISMELTFGDYVRLSKGEVQNSGANNKHILADIFEAFIGALYLDKGYDKVNDFFCTYVTRRITIILESKSYIDPKTLLQEKVQSHTKKTPVYELITYDKDKATFLVRVLIDGVEYGKGEGKSKKQAEQEAAKKAIAKLN